MQVPSCGRKIVAVDANPASLGANVVSQGNEQGRILIAIEDRRGKVHVDKSVEL